MDIFIGLISGIAIGAFILAILYDNGGGKKEITVSVVSRADDAKLCGNCNAVYDAMEHHCCPKCTSTTGMFIIHYIESEDPKIELVRKHLKNMREGKFRTTPKPEKVIALDSVRKEKVSASDLR